MALRDTPLYLHFLDRELGSSVAFEPSSHQAEHLAKCLVLATATPLYCGLSLLWECPGVSGDALSFFSLMIEAGRLAAVSHHVSVPEFFSSRQAIYSHDSRRYPMYFAAGAGERQSFRPTLYKEAGTTSTLAQEMSSWASASRVDQELPRGSQETEKIVKEKILLSLSRRTEQAITFSLFVHGLSELPRSEEIQGFLRRLISKQYTAHYLDFGGGDIPTGVRGLEYFDSLSRNFPLNDVLLLVKLIEISGLGPLLTDPWRKHEAVWQHLMMSRGLDLVQQGFRAILRSILIGCDSVIGEHGGTLFARRTSILGVLNRYSSGLSRIVSSIESTDPGAQLTEASANLTGFANSMGRSMGVDIDMIGKDISNNTADVLLVTATNVEANALIDLVRGDFRSDIVRRFIGDHTYYDFGFIGGARTFMVQSEAGSGGPFGSTLTVKHGIDTLSPRAVILVGIAFGIDPKKQEIGDILVSRQLRPYELQRIGTGPDGSCRVIPRADRPSASGRLLDRFRSGILDWNGARVKFDVVLSGDKLVDNVDFRDQLLDIEPEAIGGEMEGAGLYAAAQSAKVDWILVKSISDWADGKKRHRKEERQNVAAQSSGRFVLHVLKQGGFA